MLQRANHRISVQIVSLDSREPPRLAALTAAAPSCCPIRNVQSCKLNLMLTSSLPPRSCALSPPRRRSAGTQPNYLLARYQTAGARAASTRSMTAGVEGYAKCNGIVASEWSSVFGRLCCLVPATNARANSSRCAPLPLCRMQAHLVYRMMRPRLYCVDKKRRKRTTTTPLSQVRTVQPHQRRHVSNANRARDATILAAHHTYKIRSTKRARLAV